ncbi:Hpr(Ser) kinase/phosphatase [Candidatus Propionivibrio aalborgensis]|uniref:Hpr(Ser) kinase/phosphatase n=1 Tax=Candidatus Propionivibrio aalborgensis TaxID=1860101 RepID=A0A1A8Y0S4_9RHOO|nr:HprK-related kinase A [Candidatus Propionivibrio aalborgensis]MBK9028860.1 HprK-related kinase A [Propionivibrio sp.]SBT10607.1 Hpr(Ser) kinase/phosphatase [Candidatus Propionivibrio aalborgensis]
MKISEFTEAELVGRLRCGELLLNLGPFVARLRTDVATIAHDIALVYADFNTSPNDTFADFYVEVSLESGLRRWVKPQVRFYFDGRPSFIPLPAAQAFAMLEWGLNWCVAAHSHQYLIIHAAVVERDGRAAVLPAPPGSGKSTLCAGLVNRGWRLLSDELALFDMDSNLIYGMCRPVNLKNVSIDVIKQFAPDAVMTQPVPDTTKGTIALMRPPVESVKRMNQPARPTWVVLPKYAAGAPPMLVRHSRARCFMLIAEQSFNYHIHGSRGFDAVGQLIDHSQCFQLTYSSLDDAERVFDDLLAGRIA